MSRSVTFAYPGDLNLKTGGYGYDRRVIAGLAGFGWAVSPLSLGDGFPFPQPAVKQEAERRLSSLADGALVIVDGLAFGVLDAWAEREKERLKIVALVHHPLAFETGLDDVLKSQLGASETRALAAAVHVIATSPMTARSLSGDYEVAEGRITVALPGTDPAPASAGSGMPPHIVSVGTLTRRKGHDVLLSALKQVEDLAWSATIAGSKTLDPQTATALQRQAGTLGLGTRIKFTGECADTRALMQQGDLFALASRYEGYGMVFAEALSQGLPVIACRGGAIPDVVPEEAGILVPVDDADAFAAALRRLLSMPEERRARAAAALKAGASLPRWEETAAVFSQVLESFS